MAASATKTEKPKNPGRLSFRDETWLGWYFDDGLSRFMRSTSGPMLERSLQFAFVQQGGQTVPMSKAYPEARQPRVVDHEVVYDQREVTAQPTAEVHQVAASEPDTNVAIKMAYISRRLGRLRSEYQRAIEAFYGPEGGRCAAPVVVVANGAGGARKFNGFGLEALGGRMVALYPMVPTGKRLLASSKAATRKHGASLHLTELERIAMIVERADAKRSTDPAAWEKVMRAQREATALLAEAATAWNQISRSIKDTRGDDGRLDV